MVKYSHILFFVLFSVFASAEEKKDSVTNDTCGWKLNLGGAFSLLISKHNYSRYYGPVTPQFSFLITTYINKFFLKSELSYTYIYIRIPTTGTVIYPGKPPKSVPFMQHYRYSIINYKIGVGKKIKKFLLVPGFQIGYDFAGDLFHEDVYGAWSSYISLKRLVFLWGTFELNYMLNDKWWIGAGTSISAPVKSKNAYIFKTEKYSIYSFQFTIGHSFTKKKHKTK